MFYDRQDFEFEAGGSKVGWVQMVRSLALNGYERKEAFDIIRKLWPQSVADWRVGVSYQHFRNVWVTVPGAAPAVWRCKECGQIVRKEK